jgi:hypothetical protein
MIYKKLNGKIAAIEDIEILHWLYPQFRDDFSIFMERKIITKIGKDNYRWNFSKSSLGEYFKHIAEPKKPMLNLVERTFGIKSRSLKHLVSTNGIVWKQENPKKKSKDFEKILELLAQDSTNDIR